MQFLETTYNYVYSHMRSFASIDLYIQSPLRVAGFLYASERVAYLRLRATTRVKEEVDYAPVIFFNAQKMVHSELQYTALRPYDSFVLAVNMLTKTTLLQCYLFSSFTAIEPCPTALKLNKHTPTVTRSTVDLYRSDSEAWFPVLES